MVKGITVVVPTIGRPTLEATLSSFAPDLQASDEVFVVSDGENDWVEAVVKEFALFYPWTSWSYTWHEKVGGWGHQLRNYIMDVHADTSHIWTIDDDDIAAPNALFALRAHMTDPWTIFRMRFAEGHPANGVTCWRFHGLYEGDIGTPMIFAPLSNSRFGLGYNGDWQYACELREELGDPVFCDDLVAIIRPVAVDD